MMRVISQLCLSAAALSVALLGAACGGATGDEVPAGSSGGASSGSSGGASTGGQGPGSSGSTWAFPCGAAVQQKTVTVDLAPRCIGPGCSGSPECEAQDATFWYEVLTPAHRCANLRDIFVWDGRECASHSTLDAKGATLHCRGLDCGKTFESKEACVAVYASCHNK